MIPDQRVMADAQPGAHPGDETRLFRRLGTQAVIHGDGMQRTAAMALNAREKVQKRKGIAAARHGDADPCRPAARKATLWQMQKEGVRALPLRPAVARHWQP